MSKAAGIATCNFELLHGYPFYLLDFLYDKLCDPVARVYDLFFARKVDQNNLNFSTLICIDRARCIEAGYTLFDSEPASWPYLYFKAFRNFNVEPGGNKHPCHRLHH